MEGRKGAAAAGHGCVLERRVWAAHGGNGLPDARGWCAHGWKKKGGHHAGNGIGGKTAVIL